MSMSNSLVALKDAAEHKTEFGDIVAGSSAVLASNQKEEPSISQKFLHQNNNNSNNLNTFKGLNKNDTIIDNRSNSIIGQNLLEPS